MTAAAIYCRLVHGSADTKDPLVEKGAGLCAGLLPSKLAERRDFYYWYWGSTALFQLGDPHWSSWEKALIDTLSDLQRTSPTCAKGSWDPSGAWGEEGGRVYATAMLALALEVYVRYPRTKVE